MPSPRLHQHIYTQIRSVRFWPYYSVVPMSRFDEMSKLYWKRSPFSESFFSKDIWYVLNISCNLRPTNRCYSYVGSKNYSTILIPSKDGLIALWPSTNGSIPDFQYCPVVNWQLLRLLSTYILVYQRLAVNLNIKVSKILYQWILLLNPFCFCGT